MFKDILEEGGYEGIETLEDLQKAVDRRIDNYNNTPQDELGGLTPQQVDSLIASDLWRPDQPMTINGGLPDELASQVRIVKNSMIFIETAREEGGLPSTKAGNLKRKAVSDFLDRMKFNPDRVAKIRKYHTVINEKHVRNLNILRVFLEKAGLIEHRKSAFHPTPQGLDILEPGMASKYLKYLFFSYFWRFDLSYFTRYHEWNEFRDLLPYSLYRLSKLDDGWHRIDIIANEALLPSIFELADQRGVFRLSYTYEALVLEPLCKFELLEGKKLGIKGLEDFDPQFRKTSLFDRFLQFDLR